MRKEDIAQINTFLDDFQKETDRGAALIGASMVESRLERLLRSHFISNSSTENLFKGPNAIVGTFSSKSIICHSLGLITDKEKKEIDLIRKIRNKFAHTLDRISFEDQPITDFCLSLNADIPGDAIAKKNYRLLYINSVTLVSIGLWYRPEYAYDYRSQERKWEYSI